MLRKETFIKVIELIKKQENINEKISNALDPICEGNGFFMMEVDSTMKL